MTPSWLLDTAAAVMLVVAALSAARLATARPGHPGLGIRATDGAHLLMAVAMAGVFAPGLATLPGTAWEVVFALLTAWFAFRVLADARAGGARALAGSQCAPHLLHSAAMLYMFAALAPAPGTAGMSAMAGMSGMSAGSVSMMTLHVPTLSFGFALLLTAYSVWDLDQLSGHRASPETAPLALAGAVPASVPARTEPSPGGFLQSAAVAAGDRITLGVAMVLMLVIAL